MNSTLTLPLIAEVLRNAQQPHVQALLDDEHAAWATQPIDLPSSSEYAHCTAHTTTVTWTWHATPEHSFSCVATIIHVSDGTFSGEHVVIPAKISPEEATVCASLAIRRALPVFAAHTDL